MLLTRYEPWPLLGTGTSIDTVIAVLLRLPEVKETPYRKWNRKITTGYARPQDRVNTHQSSNACQQFPFNEHYRFRKDSNFPLYFFIIYMEQD